MRKKFENSLIKVFIITSFLLLMTAFANINGVNFMAQTVYAAPGMQINDVNATASSYVMPYSPDRAVNTFQDPSQSAASSRWYSANPGAKWLMLDLKKVYYVGGWHVEHLGSLGWDPSRNTKDFQIQTSMDGINWTTVQTVAWNTGNVSDGTIAPVTARYARLYIVSGNQKNNTWASVADFHVYAVPLNVLSVQVPANNTYVAGNTMNFIVNFPVAVSVNTSGGTPYIPLTIGSKTVNAQYISGSGTQNLIFSYTVQSGDLDADGVTLGGSINFNGGTIYDTSANSSVAGTLNNVASTAGVKVDATPKYTVTVGALSGGIITASPTSAEAGATVTLTVMPDSGKQLKVGSLKYNDGTADTLINSTSFTMPAANVTVTAVFEPIPPTLYSVTVGALTGGTITVSTASAEAGATVTLTVTPDSGKQLKVGSLKYNDGTADTLIGGTSFSMPAANVTVSAVFEPIPPTLYNVTIGALTGGNITASTTSAVYGEIVALTIALDQGNQLKLGSLKYNDGTTDTMITGTSFSMPAANVTVTAVFEPIPPTLYNVTIGTLSGGNIIESISSAPAGLPVILTVIPNPGMQLKAGSLKYNDGIADTPIVGTSFIMPAANVTVSAVFETIPPTLYTVSTATYAHGSVTVNPQIAAAGAMITITAAPDLGYQLKAGSLKYNDGTADTLISGTSFAMPAKNITVSAVFETIPIPPPGTVITPVITVSPDVQMVPNSTIVQVNVSSLTPGAAIRYTTNGDEPTVDGAVYGNAFTVTSPTTAGGSVIIKAIAVKDGMNPSGIAVRMINFLPVPPPVIVKVTSVTINSAGGAESVISGSTLQMSAAVLPDNAADKTVTWSVYSGTGTAAISTTGLLTGTGAGTVTVKATANDGSGISGIKTITITAPSVNDGGNGSGGNENVSTTGSNIISSIPPVITVITNTADNTTTATTTAQAVVGTNGGATANITQEQVSEAIAKAVNESKTQNEDTKVTVEIKVEAPASVNSVSTNIPKAAVKSLAESNVDSLAVTNPIAKITFNDAALAAINEKATTDLVIRAEKIEPNSLSDVQRKLVGERPVYDFTVMSGNSSISNFGNGKASISIPYTLKPDEDVNKIVVFYIADNGALTRVSYCKYDAATGTVTFLTNHFSLYYVGYSETSFNDVSGWSQNYINYLASKNIIQGTDKGKFSPDLNITRAEFVTILANMTGAGSNANAASAFADVQTSDWFKDAVQWANVNGVVLGENGRFNPNDNITREDMAVIIARFVEKVEGIKLNKKNSVSSFADSNEISDYAINAVTMMQQAGIISGKDNNIFDPKANATRAEAAKMITILMQSIVK